MADPFTICVFVPDGDPEGVRIIDRLNWTGLGIAFPREHWSDVRTRAEFGKTGVYILVGHTTDDDLPTLYVGQGDGIRNGPVANPWRLPRVDHRARMAPPVSEATP